jgi:hypothetical protein
MTDADALRLLLDEREIRRLADDLFVLTDRKEWAAARALFVDGEIDVDMSSLAGGGPVRMTAAQLFAGFAAGLHPGKASHHMTTNHRVDVRGDGAELWAQGYAWNHVPGLRTGDDTWETWGTYRLACARTAAGWRLTAFAYFAKRNRGNDAVRTHAPAAAGA